ncbi:MAG: hypothetical protein CMK59_13975 [Proteobacteria bacterium]|nr:hypothetical protein [Pseudomonadota bacterium]
MNNEGIEQRLIDLSSLLKERRGLWSSMPFFNTSLDWEEDYPHWSGFVRSWSECELEEFEQKPELHPRVPYDFKELAKQVKKLTNLPKFPAHMLEHSKRQSWFVKERKWAQIKRLAAIVSPLNGQGIIDWCGGKGHLGRNLAIWNNCSVWVLEKQSSLCQQAVSLGTKYDIDVHAEVLDVMQDKVQIPSDWSLVSLHACGGLSEQAMRVAVENKLRDLAISPCCYHKHIDGCRKPLSDVGSQQNLSLTATELLLPSLMETFSSKVNRERRRREMAYRLGLDLMLRAYSGHQSYRSFRSIPTSWKDFSFEDFILAVQSREGFSLPDNWRSHGWERKGWLRAREARSLGSVRNIFRRAIELWVVWDRALWLIEQGWDVQVGLWCDERLTPRNILLKAKELL